MKFASEAAYGRAMLALARSEGHAPRWRADMGVARDIAPHIVESARRRILDLLSAGEMTYGALRIAGRHGDRYLSAALSELLDERAIRKVDVIRGGNLCVGYGLTESPASRGCAAARTAIQKGDPSAVGAANAAKAAEEISDVAGAAVDVELDDILPGERARPRHLDDERVLGGVPLPKAEPSPSEHPRRRELAGDRRGDPQGLRTAEMDHRDAAVGGPGGHADDRRRLAHACAWSEPDERDAPRSGKTTTWR